MPSAGSISLAGLGLIIGTGVAHAATLSVLYEFAGSVDNIATYSLDAPGAPLPDAFAEDRRGFFDLSEPTFVVPPFNPSLGTLEAIVIRHVSSPGTVNTRVSARCDDAFDQCFVQAAVNFQATVQLRVNFPGAISGLPFQPSAHVIVAAEEDAEARLGVNRDEEYVRNGPNGGSLVGTATRTYTNGSPFSRDTLRFLGAQRFGLEIRPETVLDEYTAVGCDGIMNKSCTMSSRSRYVYEYATSVEYIYDDGIVAPPPPPVAPVPLPATFSVLLLGLGALGVLRARGRVQTKSA